MQLRGRNLGGEAGVLAFCHAGPSQTTLKYRYRYVVLVFAANFETCIKNSLRCVQGRFPYVAGACAS